MVLGASESMAECSSDCGAGGEPKSDHVSAVGVLLDQWPNEQRLD